MSVGGIVVVGGVFVGGGTPPAPCPKSLDKVYLLSTRSASWERRSAMSSSSRVTSGTVVHCDTSRHRCANARNRSARPVSGTGRVPVVTTPPKLLRVRFFHIKPVRSSLDRARQPGGKFASWYFIHGPSQHATKPIVPHPTSNLGVWKHSYL